MMKGMGRADQAEQIKQSRAEKDREGYAQIRTDQAKQSREGYEQSKWRRTEQASKDEGIREQKKSSNDNGATYLTADNRSL